MADRHLSREETMAYTAGIDMFADEMRKMIELLITRPRIAQTSLSGQAYWAERAREVDQAVKDAEDLIAAVTAPGCVLQPAEAHKVGNSLELLARLVERNHQEAGTDAVHTKVVDAYNAVKELRKTLYLDGFSDRSFRDYVDPRKARR